MSAELPAASSATGLAGEYSLKLVATSGAKKGGAAEGTLRLDPQTDSLRYRSRLGGAPDSTVLHPLYGATDVDLSLVDAVSVGSTTSLDPSRPGVLVMERRSAPDRLPRTDIIIRLGSDANRTDRQRFDGGYTALRVREVGPGRLAGSWASGVATERAAGYFCASRVLGKDKKDRKGGKEG
ncbi:MAG TPA: hypothetical protein VGP44_05440 [Gemmatimonadales bacterium]|nr:hypothetical protein [Gemmatimonadales bacterium]